MTANLRITILVENSTSDPRLGAEHGLSFWIEYGPHRILFDTGQTDLLVRNARALGIDLARTDAIVLSHGHYDHTGGLAAVLQLAPAARVWAHPDALHPKYSRHGESVRFAGTKLDAPQIRSRCGELLPVSQPTTIVPGITATGPIPRCSHLEDTGGSFFRDAHGTQPDPLVDDQALFIQTGEGIVLLLGCAHAGLVNTVRYIQQLAPGRAIRAIIGGMHLLHAGSARLDFTIEALRDVSPACLAPAHCTGAAATQMIRERFPDRFTHGQAGSRFCFE